MTMRAWHAIRQTSGGAVSVVPRAGRARLFGRSKAGTVVLTVCLTAALVISIPIAVALGGVSVSVDRAWALILFYVGGIGDPVPTAAENLIIWELRLPRVLLAAIVGCGLSVVGVVVQAMVRNPLGDPFLLGISSGAALGAVASLMLGVTWLGAYSDSLAAFVGAMLAFFIVFAVSRETGRISPLRLVLAGVGVAYVASGVTSFALTASDDLGSTQAILFWLLGSLAFADWSSLGVVAVVVLLGSSWLVMRARRVNALMIGDETAASLGVNVERLRIELFVVASLLTGVVVAAVGAIGFVGLMIPHVTRLLVGADNRRVLPLSMLVGGLFLVWVDVATRVLVAPSELPVGVMTALIGAPFFVVLMRRRDPTRV
jgi:iron complex transport system permease protein